MLMWVDASGSPIIIFVCIFAASSSSPANDFSASWAMKKEG
jgi:hypothetical protein